MPSPARALLLPLVAAGCLPGVEASSPPPPTPPGVVEVAVAAEIGIDGRSGSWSGEAHIGSVPIPRPPEPAPGTCGQVGAPQAGKEAGPIVDEVRLAGPMAGAFRWDDTDLVWRLARQQLTGDPAWAVASVELAVGGTALVLPDALRFGGAPAAEAPRRREDGSVDLAWKAGPESTVDVIVSGPAGTIRCAGDRGRVRLPWWVVPADGGEVQITAMREKIVVLAEGLVVHLTASIARWVPLDGAAAEAPPRPAQPVWLPRPAPRRPARRTPRNLG